MIQIRIRSLIQTPASLERFVPRIIFNDGLRKFSHGLIEIASLPASQSVVITRTPINIPYSSSKSYGDSKCALAFDDGIV